MSEPKFSIGNRVAAINSTLSFVVPDARIVDYKWRDYGLMRNQSGAVSEMPASWYYVLDAYPVSPISGKPFWVCERLLRPIRPDEYDETPTTTEQGISA